MRYLDQIYEVTVPIPDLTQADAVIISQWAINFHQRYEALYSYHQLDQEIRLVTLRVTVSGKLPAIHIPRSSLSGDAGQAVKGERRMYTETWCTAKVYDAARIGPGISIDGPAIIESDFTTILVEEGNRIEGDPYGGMILHIAGNDRRNTDTRTDPITRSVVEHRLESIALEMAEVMIRTSMSQILNSSRDFSTAILDAGTQLVAQGEGIPVHISALPPAAEAVTSFFAGEIKEGDLFLINDPYFGGSHLPDITAIYPIFYEGVLRFFAVNRAHHSDIGGGTHGGYNPSASEIYQAVSYTHLRAHET